MRKIFLTLAALAAFGLAVPVVSNPASAETVVIKKREHGWHPFRHHRERMIVREHRRHHGEAVVVH